MVADLRGAFIQPLGDRLTVAAAMKRYLDDIVRRSVRAQIADRKPSKIIVKHLGKYSLTSLTPEVIADYVICVWPVRTAKVTTGIRGQEQTAPSDSILL